jgi:hypothetical protein
MNKVVFVCLLIGTIVTPIFIKANEFSGKISIEARGFTNAPLYAEQKRNNASVLVEPQYYHEFNNGSSFTLVPFARYDSADKERTHYDLREFNFLWLTDYFEMRMGIGKVFWGATEFVHLVDIINQTDSVDSSSGEAKLGQPMVHLSIPTEEWGVLDMFALPYFRERTFVGEKGRLRGPLVVDVDDASYENDAEEKHFDFAFRYSNSLGPFDLGIAYFRGTSREPLLNLKVDKLVPHYEIINQTSFDIQAVLGEWLVKVEAFYRTGFADQDYYSVTGGLEYTLVGIFKSKMDLGFVAEWAYDERGDDATTVFENDLLFGLRFTLNDPASSELLAGVTQDIKSSARSVSLEGSRRFGDNLKATLEARAFFAAPEDDLLYALRDDDFVAFDIAYYF